MSSNKDDPVQMIADSPLKEVIVKGFAEVYKTKPSFPIQFLGRWLKQYSSNQALKLQLEEKKQEKCNIVVQMQRQKQERAQKVQEQNRQKQNQIKSNEDKFDQKVHSTAYPIDLLVRELPQAIEGMCQDRGVSLTGCYVGELKFRHKPLEEHNFEPGAELDAQNPKVVEYLGASKSHDFMIGEILPNQSGRSCQVFKEEEPPEEVQEGKPQKVKKKYLYVPLVQRDEKMYFFKFPKLGSFGCFPLKIKSCLFAQSFDKGIGDYKTYTQNKADIEKQFKEKQTEASGLYEQAKRKYEDHEVNEEDADSVAQHTALKQEMDKFEGVLKQIQDNPPVIQNFQYETKLKEFVVCVDTMGKDCEIPQCLLDHIMCKVQFFQKEWEEKEYQMLLDDIGQFIQDEPTLETQFNFIKDQQQSIIGSNQATVKEQCGNREKQSQYELSVLKVGKLIKILQEQGYANSMTTYLNYKIQKYSQIVQIVLMILGHRKADINLPRSNSLDCRKCLRKQFIENMMNDFENYELRRQSSETVDNEYKINKLLERLQKIDGETVGKYNSWLFGLLFVAKSVCWARIQGRDAKIQAHQLKVKAMNDREAQIVKYDEQFEKAKEAAIAQGTQQAPYNEQEWLKEFITQNPKPQPLQVDELKQFLDIE